MRCSQSQLAKVSVNFGLNLDKHEVKNKRLNQFVALRKQFRHKFDLHLMSFAVINIVQRSTEAIEFFKLFKLPCTGN